MIIKLEAQTRENREKLSSDFIPGVLYGKERDNQNLKIKKINFNRVFREAGESNLIDLDYGDGVVKVLIKATQRDVLKDSFIHVDFYQVNMKEKIIAEIPLYFVGESPAIKELGGVLIKDSDVLAVECLPGDLVDHIDVDISVLKTFNDAIRVNDLKLSSGLSLMRDTNDMVAAIREPKAEEEEPEIDTSSKVTENTNSEKQKNTEENKEGETGSKEKNTEISPERK